ncbi:hypothetical protein D3C73_920430 [compost metagenome]
MDLRATETGRALERRDVRLAPGTGCADHGAAAPNALVGVNDKFGFVLAHRIHDHGPVHVEPIAAFISREVIDHLVSAGIPRNCRHRPARQGTPLRGGKELQRVPAIQPGAARLRAGVQQDDIKRRALQKIRKRQGALPRAHDHHIHLANRGGQGHYWHSASWGRSAHATPAQHSAVR